MRREKSRGVGRTVLYVVLAVAGLTVLGSMLFCGGCCGALSILPTLTPSITPTASKTPTPSLTPLPTETPTVGPSPTSSETPVPTDTPTLTATPTLRNRLSQRAQSHFLERYVETEITDQTGTVYCRLGTVWDDTDAVRQGIFSLIGFAPMAFEIEGLGALELVIIAPFTDAYGNSEDDVAFDLRITRAAAQKVNWDAVDPAKIPYILRVNEGCNAYVHPGLQAAWAAYQID